MTRRIVDPLGGPFEDPGPTSAQRCVRLTRRQNAAFETEARKYGMSVPEWLRALGIDAIRQKRAPFTEPKR